MEIGRDSREGDGQGLALFLFNKIINSHLPAPSPQPLAPEHQNDDSSARPQIAFGEESCYVPLAVKSYCWKLAEESKIVDQGRTLEEDPGKSLGEVLQRKP